MWQQLQSRKEKLFNDGLMRMEPTVMVEDKEESMELEPICLKNDPEPVATEIDREAPLLKEPSCKKLLT